MGHSCTCEPTAPGPGRVTAPRASLQPCLRQGCQLPSSRLQFAAHGPRPRRHAQSLPGRGAGAHASPSPVVEVAHPDDVAVLGDGAPLPPQAPWAQVVHPGCRHLTLRGKRQPAGRQPGHTASCTMPSTPNGTSGTPAASGSREPKPRYMRAAAPDAAAPSTRQLPRSMRPPSPPRRRRRTCLRLMSAASLLRKVSSPSLSPLARWEATMHSGESYTRMRTATPPAGACGSRRAGCCAGATGIWAAN